MWMREKCSPGSAASGLAGPTGSASIAVSASASRPARTGAMTVSE